MGRRILGCLQLLTILTGCELYQTWCHFQHPLHWSSPSSGWQTLRSRLFRCHQHQSPWLFHSAPPHSGSDPSLSADEAVPLWILFHCHPNNTFQSSLYKIKKTTRKGLYKVEFFNFYRYFFFFGGGHLKNMFQCKNTTKIMLTLTFLCFLKII